MCAELISRLAEVRDRLLHETAVLRARLRPQAITAAHREQYQRDRFFVLEDVIPPDMLELLRGTAADAVAGIESQMDVQGTDTLGINHRGKRYFVGQSYARHRELGRFLFSDLKAGVCRATFGGEAYLHNDQYVIKRGRTGMSFSWHQDSAYVHARIGDQLECVACWCALDDVGEHNGTVYLLPVSRHEQGRTLVEHKQDSV